MLVLDWLYADMTDLLRGTILVAATLVTSGLEISQKNFDFYVKISKDLKKNLRLKHFKVRIQLVDGNSEGEIFFATRSLHGPLVALTQH